MKSRGFSLIEILVVLILLSLSLGLVVPSLSRFLTAVELKGAAQKISAILRNCRSEAVNKGKGYQVVFNSRLREISVYPLAPSEERDEKKEAPLAEKAYVLPQGIQMKGEPTTSSSSGVELSPIEFYPNGASSGGTIFLASPDRSGYKINVHFLTGVVEITRLR